MEVASELNAPEEPQPRVPRDLVERLRNGLDPLMVRRNAGADEAEGGGEPVEEIDTHLELVRSEQPLCCIEPRGAGPDDGDVKHVS